MSNPTISIIGPAHRTRFWLETYQSICQNNISFEIIFVSDKHPDFTLPDHFRYIYSTVKPVQCVEIALREAQGELIHWTADDTTYNPHAFDNAYDLYKSKDDYKAMICFEVYESGIYKTDCHYLFHHTTITPPKNMKIKTMPFGLMSRQMIKEIGTCDTGFIAGQWENDLTMRAYAYGAKMYICKEAIAYNDDSKHGGEDNLKETHTFESELLYDLWVKEGKLTLNRSCPLHPFSSENILTISQGNSGKWQ